MKVQCVKPIKGFRGTDGKVRDARNSMSYRDKPVTIPCGRCRFCRLEKSRQWATRIMHEQQTTEEKDKGSCFATLTYATDFLPRNGGLNAKDWQIFCKRLRRRFASEKIRYFCGAEYGERYLRPHFHAAIFGVDFRDDREFHDRIGDFDYYTSATLNALWGKGNCLISDLTFDSAAYCARYAQKKITGELAEKENAIGLLPYERIDAETGEVYRVRPEFCVMSRKPGLGQEWIKKYLSDVYPRDYVIVRGVKCKPPQYYDNYLLEVDPVMHEEVMRRRRINGESDVEKMTESQQKKFEKGLDVLSSLDILEEFGRQMDAGHQRELKQNVDVQEGNRAPTQSGSNIYYGEWDG